MMDRAEWAPTYEGPPAMGEPPDMVDLKELGICPGWLGRLPSVIEGAQAYASFRNGELSTYFPDPSNGLLDAAMCAAQSFNAFEAAQIRKASNRQG